MYDALFSEVQLGNHTLENRFIFRGPATGFAREGRPGAQLVAYYLERAKGGAGLIELEPGLSFDKSCFAAWRDFTELIHTYGTRVVARIETSFAHAYEIKDIAGLIYKAGLDGISLDFSDPHAIIGSAGVISSNGNERYVEAHKLVRSISEDCGDHFIIGVHIPEERENAADACQSAVKLWEESGASYLILPDNDDGSGEIVKSDLTIPAGKMVTCKGPKQCTELIEEGSVDLIALSEQLVCDPYWPMKVQLGHEKEIRNFIDEAENESVQDMGHIVCALNPYLGQESKFSEYNMTPAAKCKSIVIVGGGPAGMQAAITASQRGHNVFLCERDTKLGGKLNTEKLADAAKWFIDEMKRNQVDVHLGLPVTTEHITAHTPDVVIMASNGDLKAMIQKLREKGIQVIEIEEDGCSIGRAIRSGFRVAIGI